MTTGILIDKLGVLKEQNIKSLKLQDLYKKCGYKKSDNFEKQAEWRVKIDGKEYNCALYGKKVGKANFENKSFNRCIKILRSHDMIQRMKVFLELEKYCKILSITTHLQNICAVFKIYITEQLFPPNFRL